jgi:Amidohydrolase family
MIVKSILNASLAHSIIARLASALHASVLLGAILIGFCGVGLAQDYELAAPGTEDLATPAAQAKGTVTLFQNVRIFDGKSSELSAPSNVLVKGNTIQRITVDPIDKASNAHVVQGGGRVLMPGLIDAHWHAFMAATPQTIFMTAQPSYLHLLAARQAEATLMRGFTTVRDLGGPVFGLKRAIDEGVMIGPRIYPSGAFISQRIPSWLALTGANAGGERSHCRRRSSPVSRAVHNGNHPASSSSSISAPRRSGAEHICAGRIAEGCVSH